MIDFIAIFIIHAEVHLTVPCEYFTFIVKAIITFALWVVSPELAQFIICHSLKATPFQVFVGLEHLNTIRTTCKRHLEFPFGRSNLILFITVFYSLINCVKFVATFWAELSICCHFVTTLRAELLLFSLGWTEHIARRLVTHSKPWQLVVKIIL